MSVTPSPQLKASIGRKPRGLRGVRVEHCIAVQAPAEVIWRLIGDLGGWGDWNPMYPQVRAVGRVGETFTATIAIPGLKPTEFGATIQAWAPNEQLHWRAGGGLTRELRYVEIEPLAEQSCVVVNGEIFGGPLGALAPCLLGGRIHKGFRLMNEALKAAAEARWRER